MFEYKQFLLSRVKAIGFLDALEKVSGPARTLYLPPGLSLADAGERLEKYIDPKDVPPEVSRLVVGSGTGAVFFWSPVKMCLVLPPFPVTEEFFAPGYDVERLRAALQRDWTIALVLVRLGAYAVGLCRGESLVRSKVGTGLVHGRHRQGGSSAQRFGLRRANQIDSFLDRVCGHVREQIGPQTRVDYVAYGGARTTILLLRKLCPFLQQYDDRTLPPLLDIPEPRQAVLESAVGRVWSSRIIEWDAVA